VLLLDNSAFSRLHDPRVDQSRADYVAEQIERRQIAVCMPFMLEAGYSARGANDHDALMLRLRRFKHLPITSAVEDLALLAHSELARSGQHRVKPADIIIAALAHTHGCGVLHYDHHYDTIAAASSLSFPSEWLAPPGSLD
jgi:predicted nucleic acid-binding protein